MFTNSFIDKQRKWSEANETTVFIGLCMTLCLCLNGVQETRADVADDFLDQLVAEDIELSNGYSQSLKSEEGHDVAY